MPVKFKFWDIIVKCHCYSQPYQSRGVSVAKENYKYYVEYTYTKKILVVYLIFKFKWASYIWISQSGNCIPEQSKKKRLLCYLSLSLCAGSCYFPSKQSTFLHKAGNFKASKLNLTEFAINEVWFSVLCFQV